MGFNVIEEFHLLSCIFLSNESDKDRRGNKKKRIKGAQVRSIKSGIIENSLLLEIIRIRKYVWKIHFFLRFPLNHITFVFALSRFLTSTAILSRPSISESIRSEAACAIARIRKYLHVCINSYPSRPHLALSFSQSHASYQSIEIPINEDREWQSPWLCYG